MAGTIDGKFSKDIEYTTHNIDDAGHIPASDLPKYINIYMPENFDSEMDMKVDRRFRRTEYDVDSETSTYNTTQAREIAKNSLDIAYGTEQLSPRELPIDSKIVLDSIVYSNLKTTMVTYNNDFLSNDGPYGFMWEGTNLTLSVRSSIWGAVPASNRDVVDYNNSILSEDIRNAWWNVDVGGRIYKYVNPYAIWASRQDLNNEEDNNKWFHSQYRNIESNTITLPIVISNSKFNEKVANEIKVTVTSYNCFEIDPSTITDIKANEEYIAKQQERIGSITSLKPGSENRIVASRARVVAAKGAAFYKKTQTKATVLEAMEYAFPSGFYFTAEESNLNSTKGQGNYNSGVPGSSNAMQEGLIYIQYFERDEDNLYVVFTKFVGANSGNNKGNFNLVSPTNIVIDIKEYPDVFDFYTGSSTIYTPPIERITGRDYSDTYRRLENANKNISSAHMFPYSNLLKMNGDKSANSISLNNFALLNENDRLPKFVGSSIYLSGKTSNGNIGVFSKLAIRCVYNPVSPWFPNSKEALYSYLSKINASGGVIDSPGISIMISAKIKEAM